MDTQLNLDAFYINESNIKTVGSISNSISNLNLGRTLYTSTNPHFNIMEIIVSIEDAYKFLSTYVEIEDKEYFDPAKLLRAFNIIFSEYKTEMKILDFKNQVNIDEYDGSWITYLKLDVEIKLHLNTTVTLVISYADTTL